ncbi:hypothetical protein TNCV_3315071 [Trichonephila clavipes]|nr:hypothetical protein TNCV_3315071 [Trichonephila clavipes]
MTQLTENSRGIRQDYTEGTRMKSEVFRKQPSVTEHRNPISGLEVCVCLSNFRKINIRRANWRRIISDDRGTVSTTRVLFILKGAVLEFNDFPWNPNLLVFIRLRVSTAFGGAVECLWIKFLPFPLDGILLTDGNCLEPEKRIEANIN